jgi:hypothetical protein
VRTIIAGSRDGISWQQFRRAMNLVDIPISVVISGTARGVDSYGERWASEKGIPVERYPADWEQYGKRAGYLRNVQMAENADALILIWTGDAEKSRGSAHMKRIAYERGLLVRSYWPRPEVA